MTPINKDGILYQGVCRGRRRLLAVCVVLALLTAWYAVSHRDTLVGKFHGPYELDYTHFAQNTQTEAFTEPIKMKLREDRSVSTGAYFGNSYTKDGAYRFSVTLGQVEETDVHYDVTVTNPDTGAEEQLVLMRIYLAAVGDSVVPVMVQGDRVLSSGDTVTGIFTEPAKVIRADLSAAASAESPVTVNQYMLNTLNVEMETENSDPWFIGILLALILFLAIKLARYYLRPLTHPTYTQLLKYGELDEVIQSVDSQAASDKAYTRDKWLVLPDWIVSKKAFKLSVVKNHMASGKYS